MFKRIFFTFLLFFTSSQAFAAFIYADDFTVGQDVSRLTDNATLNWLEGTGNRSTSRIFSPGAFYHQHFGGLTSATTYDTIPGLLSEVLGSPNPQIYAALEISFATAVRSFGVKIENHTSSPFALFLYDTEGTFLEVLSAEVVRTGQIFPDGGIDWPIFQGTHIFNFDVDVGRIKIGGASDAGYIYALDVSVPAPSSIFLICTGLLCLVATRRLKLSNRLLKS